MSSTSVDQVLKEISGWCKRDHPFGYVYVCRKRHGCLVDRARALMRSCVSDGVRLVYCVMNGWERDVLASVLKASTDFSKPSRICILSHADLYELSRTSLRDQLLDSDVILMCEVDAQASLEYSFALYNLMYGVEKAAYREAHVLMVSSGIPCDPVLGLLQCVAPSVAGLKTFDLRIDEPAQSLPDVIQGKAFDGATAEEIGRTLSNGADVLVYCGELDRGRLGSILEEVVGAGKPCLEVRIWDPRRPVTTFVRAIRKTEQDGQTYPPTLFVVDGADRMPFRIRGLGLVVILGRPTKSVFSQQLCHVVRVPYELSRSEFVDAVAVADLSGARVLSAVAIDDLERAMPPKRIEHDQHQAFLFEWLRMSQGVVARNQFLSCLEVGFYRIEDSADALLASGCIEQTSASGDDFSVPKTDRMRKLTALLPKLAFDFGPAAFLSSFATDESDQTLRVAVRLAAIMHCHDLLLSYDPPTWCASYEVPVAVQDFEEALPLVLSPACSLPPNILLEGILWIKLALWNMLSMETKGFTELLRDFDEGVTMERVDVLAGTRLEKSTIISRSACLRINEVVQSLEKTLHLPPVPPSKIDVTESEVARIQAELLRAHPDRIIWFKPQGNSITHQNGMQTTKLLPPDAQREYLHHAGSRLETCRIFPALTLKVEEILQDGSQRWKLSDIVVIPMGVIARQQSARGLI